MREKTDLKGMYLSLSSFKENIQKFKLHHNFLPACKTTFDKIACKTTFINVEKRSFSKTIVFRFLKVQNEWVVFKNYRFFFENETIVFITIVFKND